MSKLTQLETIRQLGLPIPPFTAISWEQFKSGRWHAALKSIQYPVAIRSSYSSEDSHGRSMAGRFVTRLNVVSSEMEATLREVFESYPDREGQWVIVQEMITEPTYSGVLFAYRQGVWKVEYVPQSEVGVVGGSENPETLLLPRFGRLDVWASRFFPIWQPFEKKERPEGLVRPFIRLSNAAIRLSQFFRADAPHGLDIEFAISNGRLYLLQARPITTPGDAEDVLTSANHKEILPPIPSPMMTAIIHSCSSHLFSYYHRLDPTLPDYRFIKLGGNMPWINLSALLDTMVYWGLPTSLVCESVGAEDVYRVNMRPYRWMLKWPVFLRVLRDQLSTIGKVRRWVRHTQRYLLTEQEARRLMWRNNPDLAFNNWLTNMQLVYTELVTLMQAVTGTMAGPVKLFSKLGLLHHLRERSESTRYLEAFRLLVEGKLSRETFLKDYGHRGFYESDIGQRRFFEYGEEDWKVLLENNSPDEEGTSQLPSRKSAQVNFLIRPFVRMIHTREWLRNHAMRYFWLLREEIQEAIQGRFGEDLDFADYKPNDLLKALEGKIEKEELLAISYPKPQGWEPDTFLQNRLGRQIPITAMSNLTHTPRGVHRIPIGLYPGKIRGQIWRVKQADLQRLDKPPFEKTILLTESLDPSWIPYFVKVDGVISKMGGILSHASIILRESHIPSITQYEGFDQLTTGDWVEMDGGSGKVEKL